MGLAAYRFGDVEVCPDRREVLIRGTPTLLGSRSFDVLMTLLERRDRVVTKRELLDAVWPGLVVEENNLVVQIATLRKVLGATTIATIPGRGYRFVTPASPHHAAADAAAVSPAVADTGFVGRAQDVRALHGLVHEQRLVTLTGPSGVGKSRLAEQVLAACRDEFADGVAWVDLAALSEPVQVCGAIARSLGMQPGAGELLTQIVRAAQPLRMLVVLDNAEHLVTEVARVAKTLVAGAPGLHLLVTSQAALNVSSEWLMRLEPLALPPAPMPVPDARTFDAVQLFAQRAQAADHRFELHEQNVEAVIEICRRLDGLPLALELAAARVRLLGATGLAAALHERLKLLGPAYRHAPARQRTLRAALEWSWALLDADHSVVLRRLGVFAGSFSLQMAQAVCADGDLDAWAVVDLLGALVDHSLVMVLAGDVPRYRLLESMRALALERLGEAGEVEAIRRRHAHAMLARFEQMYEDRFAGRIRVDDALAALMPDYDNAIEAARWAVQHDVPTAVALMNPLTVPFRLMGLPELYELWTQTAGLLHTTLKPVCRAGWLMGACTVWRRDKPALAAEHGRQAVELYRRHGPARELYLALDGVAGAERSTDAQEQLWREMMAIERPEWPPAVRSAGAWVRALMRHRGGDPESALRAYEQAAALDAQAGDSARLAAGRANLMDLCLLLGRIDDAVAYGLQLVEQLEKKRQGTLLVFALVNLTAAWLAKDEVAAARAAATRLLALVFQPYFDFRAIFSTYLAEMAALERRSVDAARFIGYSDRIYAETTAREGYEVLAAERARRLAREQLGDAAYEREVRTGGSMSDEVMEQMARQMLAATLQV